jgi:hypothetical protein
MIQNNKFQQINNIYLVTVHLYPEPTLLIHLIEEIT